MHGPFFSTFLPPMRHPEIPVGAAIAALLILIPLPSQIRARNVALIVLIIDNFIINIILIVNSLLWAGHARDIAPVWCDISQSDSVFPIANPDIVLNMLRSYECLCLLPGFSNRRGILLL
jgi:hypothetical protein